VTTLENQVRFLDLAMHKMGKRDYHAARQARGIGFDYTGAEEEQAAGEQDS
jgi:hypothetical protein